MTMRDNCRKTGKRAKEQGAAMKNPGKGNASKKATSGGLQAISHDERKL